MTNLLRVKDPSTGHEFDVPPSRLTVCPDLIVLDKATGPTKPRLPLGQPIPGGQVDRKRRSARARPSTQTPATEKPQADENDGHAVNTEEEN